MSVLRYRLRTSSNFCKRWGLLLLGLMLVSQPGLAFDDAGLADWVESAVGAPMARGAASAATVSVVDHGEIVVVRRYGLASPSSPRPVGPHDRFVIASVSKTFTASIVERLVQSGRIASVDDPANRYLKRIQLPRYGGVDITIRQLLTHSAGFEERALGIASLSDRSFPATGEYIRAHLPAVVRAPGSAVVYANIDPALLGTLVEDITGLNFRQLIHQEILEPLGMQDTDLRYGPGLGEAVVVASAMGADGIRQPMRQDANVPFFAPTGSIQTTAEDMGRFMLAQLGYASQVLPPQAAQALHAPLATNGAPLGSIAMAFFVSDWNGTTVVGHAGEFSGYDANLVLIPRLGLGLFVAWAGGPVTGTAPLDLNALRDGFLRHVLGPYTTPPAMPDAPPTQSYVGSYWSERRPHTDAESLVSIDDVMEVTAGPGQTLYVGGGGPYYAFAPGYYVGKTDGSRQPRVYRFTPGTMASTANIAHRVGALTDPRTLRDLAAILLAICVSGLAAPFYSRGVRVSAAVIIAVAALALVSAALAPNPWGSDFVGDIFAGNRLRFVILAIASVSLPVAGVSLAGALLHSRSSAGSLPAEGRLGRSHLWAVAVAAFASIGPSLYFHLPAM